MYRVAHAYIYHICPNLGLEKALVRGVRCQHRLHVLVYARIYPYKYTHTDTKKRPCLY